MHRCTREAEKHPSSESGLNIQTAATMVSWLLPLHHSLSKAYFSTHPCVLGDKAKGILSSSSSGYTLQANGIPVQGQIQQPLQSKGIRPWALEQVSKPQPCSRFPVLANPGSESVGNRSANASGRDMPPTEPAEIMLS